jgi:hypothetical protein
MIKIKTNAKRTVALIRGHPQLLDNLVNLLHFDLVEAHDSAVQCLVVSLQVRTRQLGRRQLDLVTPELAVSVRVHGRLEFLGVLLPNTTPGDFFVFLLNSENYVIQRKKDFSAARLP